MDKNEFQLSTAFFFGYPWRPTDNNLPDFSSIERILQLFWESNNREYCIPEYHSHGKG